MPHSYRSAFGRAIVRPIEVWIVRSAESFYILVHGGFVRHLVPGMDRFQKETVLFEVKDGVRVIPPPSVLTRYSPKHALVLYCTHFLFLARGS